MNKLDLTQTGGFPLDQEVLSFQQDNIFLASKAANLGGNLYIISGCVDAGTNVGNGFVSIDGEVLPFVGGAKQDNVIIYEEKTALLYEDNVPREVQINRYAVFGENGVKQYAWSAFRRNTDEGILKRLDRLELLARPFIAGGSVMVWNRPHNEIPIGWREAVAYRGLMLMHRKVNPDGSEVEGFKLGQTGGVESVKMQLENLIEHDHIIYGQDNSGFATGFQASELSNIEEPGSDKAYFQRHTSKTGSADPVPMKTISPYRIVEFIEPDPEALKNI